MGKIVNPALESRNVVIHFGDDTKSPGEELTAAQAKKYADKSFAGVPIVVEAGTVSAESDED